MTAEFDRIAEEAAEGVRLLEPDTLVYVIHVVPKAPMQRIIYEVYRDRAAFESHESQPHIRRFAEARKSCVLATNIIDLRLKFAKVAALFQGGGQPVQPEEPAPWPEPTWTANQRVGDHARRGDAAALPQSSWREFRALEAADDDYDDDRADGGRYAPGGRWPGQYSGQRGGQYDSQSGSQHRGSGPESGSGSGSGSNPRGRPPWEDEPSTGRRYGEG